jgi:hypothetical protein
LIKRFSIIAGRVDIQKQQFIGTLSLVNLRRRDRIPNIFMVGELHTFDAPTVP